MLKRSLKASLATVAALATCVGCSVAGDAPAASEPAEASEMQQYTADRSEWPDPPQIPADFTWSGEYYVPDLGIEVPFSWNGRDGDFQMIAGGDEYPIHFTNIISSGELFTLTYKWPDVPRLPCSHVGAFTLDELNAGFAEATFVGEETLHFDSDVRVNHFRSAGVLDLSDSLPIDLEGVPVRIPIMLGDIYVDVDDSSQLRQLLHFGLQNLYDPNLDEWIVIDESSDEAGKVDLPKECVVDSES